jgi:peptide/nickel transport system permease protein
MSTAATTTVEMRPGGLWLAFSQNRLAWVGPVLLAVIVLVVIFAPWLALNLLGDALRDASDPRSRAR